MTSLSRWVGGACGVLAVAAPAWAHGGSHPSPWPTPTPSTSFPPPSPSPAPSTTPVGPTKPFGSGYRPTRTGRPPGTTNTPSGPTQPRASGDDRTGWETWWGLNARHYLLVKRRVAQVTGQSGSTAATT